MNEGTVKWFDEQKNYGFIRMEDQEEDLFVHASNVEEEGSPPLREGQRVEFTIEETDRGPAAYRVQPTTKQEDPPDRDGDETETQSTRRDEPTGIEDIDFEDLGIEGPVLEGTRHAGFDNPRKVQVEAIPPLLEGRDLICSAPTGTGKTAAFLLPMLQDLAGENTSSPRGLILAPTHELADQIKEEAVSLASRLDLNVDTVYGGTDIHNEMLSLREGVDVLVACPGRLIDHMGRKNVELDHVEQFVLDEADRMCDMGFLPQIKNVRRKLPGTQRNQFFSATIPDEIEDLASRMTDDPVRISVGQQTPVETIDHFIAEVDHNRKFEALRTLLDRDDRESVLVFCRTRNTVRNLTKKLRKNRYRACGLQGGMDDVARDETLSAFRNQQFEILVATNVAARGLDVEHISHVINYDVPEDPDVYTHRLGRTGRAGMEGEAYTLATPSDRGDVKSIESTIDYRVDRVDLNV